MLTQDFMKLWLIIIILNEKNGGAKSWQNLAKTQDLFAGNNVAISEVAGTKYTCYLYLCVIRGSLIACNLRQCTSTL